MIDIDKELREIAEMHDINGITYYLRKCDDGKVTSLLKEITAYLDDIGAKHREMLIDYDKTYSELIAAYEEDGKIMFSTFTIKML